MATSQSSFSCGKAPLFPFRGKSLSKRAKVRAASFGGSLLLCALLFWLNGAGALPMESNVSASGLVSPEPPAYLLSLSLIHILKRKKCFLDLLGTLQKG